jgi:hypothetical protein
MKHKVTITETDEGYILEAEGKTEHHLLFNTLQHGNKDLTFGIVLLGVRQIMAPNSPVDVVIPE